MTSVRELKRRIDFQKRNLLRTDLATEEEIAAIFSKHEERRAEHRWIYIWGDLRVLIALKMKDKGGGRIPPDAMAAAILALEEAPETVWLPSLKQQVVIWPAGFEKINAIERLEWWMPRLEAGRIMLMRDKENGRPSKADSRAICDACERPTSPGNLDELLQEIALESAHMHSWIYAHATSGSPAPAEEPVTWASQITVLEHMALVQAYHRVNRDIIEQLPKPMSRDGDREQPRHWSFLFAHQADHQQKPPIEIMRNQSLAGLIAVVSLEAITAQRLRAKGKVDAKKFEKSFRR